MDVARERSGVLKHIDTRRYLILDAKGRSYVRRDGETVRVDFQKEFRRVVEAIDARSVR